MINDVAIVEHVKLIEESCKRYLEEVKQLNHSAYSDVMLEGIFNLAKKTEKLHLKNRAE